MNRLTGRALRKAAIGFAIISAVCSAHAEVVLFVAITRGALYLID